ncbi:hypothetical protein P8452_10960 [Trifolium repens]|nr:hypothetical protein P8452_10960 [Trifolium repens]
MAFWHRIQKSKLKTAYFQFRRCYTHLPHASFLNSTPKTCPVVMPNPYSLFHDRPTNFLNSVRFYAVPVQFQVKPKNEDDDIDGPRLNDQVKARFVRLVGDDGHSVVSRFEALERAKTLKLDLVEVDRNANPPVCKIMDYHKEMYKKKESDKERAKSKSEMTLRKDVKEVRFSEKTESKDLKMKSDMVKKQMEKGYRVKVKATGNADQAMLDAISRLSALIEDVCVVESGPHLTKKEAYIVVRHIKYGPAKKGAKKPKDAAQSDVKAEEGDVEPLTTNTSDSEFPFSPNRPEKSINNGNDPESPPVLENRYKKVNHHVENKVQPTAQMPPAAVENRYIKAEPRNRFQQPTPNTGPSPGPVPGTRDSNRWSPPNLNQPRHVPVSNTGPGPGPGPRDANRWTPPNLNQPRHAPVDINFNPNINSPPGSRNSMPSRDDINKNPRGPNTTSPGYGIFSRDA